MSRHSCLKCFRDSASERVSFKKTQFLIVDCTTKRFISANSSPPATPTPVARQDPQSRMMRSQAETERVQVPLIATNKTPKRGVAKKLVQLEERLHSGKIDLCSQIVLERSKECTGFPIKRLGPGGNYTGSGSRGSCAVCATPTHHFCLHCKQWFCMTQTTAALKKVVIINGNGDDAMHVERTCFYHRHRNNQEALLQKFNQRAQSMLLDGSCSITN